MNTKRKKFLWGLMTFLAVGITLVVVGQYASGDPDYYFPQQKLVYIAHRTGLMTHIWGGGLALLIGPFQFLPAMRRQKFVGLHRWLGRLYLLGVLFGGLAGLYMATMAYGGFVAHVGFGLLAVFWLVTGYFAYQRIRAGDVQAHRRWMTRNFALTFAAVTLRLWLPILAFAIGIEFTKAYMMVAWLAWVPNLIVAEWLVRRQQNHWVVRQVAVTAVD